MYRLHGFCQSGPTFKVAFALRALKQPWEPVLVDFMNGATRQDGWRESINEMGEAPVLEGGTLAPGRRLTQSGAMAGPCRMTSCRGSGLRRSGDRRLTVVGAGEGMCR